MTETTVRDERSEAQRDVERVPPRSDVRAREKGSSVLGAASEEFELAIQARARARLVELGLEDVEPLNRIEEDLRENLLIMAMQFERMIAARKATRNLYVREPTDRRELDAAIAVCRLLHDPRGPTGKWSPRRSILTDPQQADANNEDPVDAARVVGELEKTAEGCKCLLDAWVELRTRLEGGGAPGFSFNLQVARLMGKKLRDALVDPEVAEVFVASHAFERWEGDAFGELRHELPLDEIKEGLLRLRRNGFAFIRPRGEKEGYARIFQIIARAESALRVKLQERLKFAESEVERKALEYKNEQSSEAQRRARFEERALRNLRRHIGAFRKFRANSSWIKSRKQEVQAQ